MVIFIFKNHHKSYQNLHEEVLESISCAALVTNLLLKKNKN
jgi:hypothetical protein